jgi:group II intron reverse transcriptase/maturase
MKTFDEINETMLYRCLMRIRPWTAPGIDGITRNEFRLSDGLSILARQLQNGTFVPSPCRRVWLPKPGADPRPLAVPTIRDRVAQAAMAGLLSCRYEPEFFDGSFGFRPGRRANQAVRAAMRAVELRRTPIVVEFDIEGFFDSVRHEDVLTRLVEDRIDPRIVGLVTAFLRTPIDDGGVVSVPTIGTPQGGPLSPILANLILDRALDAWFPARASVEGWADPVLIRYADDFVIIVGDIATAKQVLALVAERLGEFRLTLSAKKTRWVSLRPVVEGERADFDFLGWTIRYGEHEHGRRLVRRTSQKSIRRTLQRLKREMRDPAWRKKTPSERHDWFLAVVRGHREYFGIAENEELVRHFTNRFERLFRLAEHRTSTR